LGDSRAGTHHRLLAISGTASMRYLSGSAQCNVRWAARSAAASVARVLLGRPLVPAPVVSGQPGHQLLRILPLHPGEELRGPLPAQGGGVHAVVGDAHGPAAVLVVEAVGV